jgi:phosphoglycolate phosphatase
MLTTKSSIKAAIVFDLDGTLVDTAPDLLACLNFVLTNEGHTQVEPSQLRHLVGHGVRYLFEQAFAETGKPVPADRLDMLGNRFLDHYRANIARHSVPFKDVPDTLSKLAREGYGLGVCTNKPHDLTELLLTELDLAKYFPAVMGTGKVPYNKPDARHVTDVIEALSGTRERAVMVGDSHVDVAAAKAAGIPVIAMGYGYSPVPAEELGADAVTSNFSEIPGLISALLGDT